LEVSGEMTMEKILSSGMRVLFIIAFGLLAVAVSEALANALGYTITRGAFGNYTAGRLLEFAAMFLVFVVTLLLRQIRDQLKGGSGRASESKV
jgi:hypothetical protein